MSDELYKVAVDYASRAHAPYSKYLVGAAIKTKCGKIFGGCNVENASYGGTVCAERTAILKAVSDGYKEFDEILVFTDSEEPWPPCAICQQTMAEFMTKTAIVYLSNKKGLQKKMQYGDINPFPFKL